MGEQDEKPIRVVDRRMFTADGELRPDFEPEEPASPPSPPPPPASPTGSAPGANRSAAPAAGESPRARPPAPFPEPDTAGGPEPDETGEPAEPAAGGEPRGEFIAIVRSLATTAYSALGLLPDPSGRSHREPAVARQMIDWLTVLESKTRNNLSFEESDFLSRVLYELRMAFVEVMGAGGTGAGRPRPPGR
jgi:hypothetical protein